MSKLFMLLLSMSIFVSVSLAQSQYAFRGNVVDENNRPLHGATIFLQSAQKGCFSDIHGNFLMNNLSVDKSLVEISFMGYKTLVDTVSFNDDKCIHFQLIALALNLQEVVVKDDYIEQRKKEASLNIELVNKDYLKQNLSGSLMGSLERLAGVSSIKIGSGQSKPVIRGLGFNRVVVVENNIKHEAQQWGTDHGLEIDQYAIEDVEVIKGPASLMYGSDAIGGVIDMKNRAVPLDDSFGGTVDFTGKSNNDLVGTSLSLYARKKWFFANIRATILDYGDYKVPTDSVEIYSYKAALHNNQLRNTAGKEQNVHLSFGIIQQRFQSKFFVSNVNSKSGFFANAHGLEPRNVDAELYDKSSRDILYPYQEVNHFKISNSSFYTWDKAEIEWDLGYQRNFRQERSQYVQHGYMPALFPDTLDFDSNLERQFDKQVYSGNVKLSYEHSEQTEVQVGINSTFQDNQIGGRGFIIPTYKQFGLGGFAYGNYILSEKSRLQAGIRYDYGRTTTEAYYDWFPSPVTVDGDTTYTSLQRAASNDLTFSNLSWSLGYNYNLENWSIKANAGKSFRMPIAKELGANGVNYHHFSYEVGDPNLSPEISYQFDFGLEYHGKNFAIGISPFVNYFSNYIYLNPSSGHDRLYGNGNQIFYHTESEVFRYGGELHAHYELFKNVQLGFIGEYVYSLQLSGEKKGFTLPFSPPPSGIFNLKYTKRKLRFMENIYASIDYRLTAPQNNIVPPELPTKGYQVVNLALGGNLMFKHQPVHITMQIQNLFNTKYFNHTSYYRLINVPEPGRNFILNISIPFSGNITN